MRLVPTDPAQRSLCRVDDAGVNSNWLRHRHRAPEQGDGQVRRDSAEYQRAHSEARELVAAYLRDIGATRVDDGEVAPLSPIPSARVALARRSAA
jgi:hypothetical protein